MSDRADAIRFDEMLAVVLDGQPSPEDYEALSTMLAEDVDRRAIYRQMIETHSLLIWERSLGEQSTPGTTVVNTPLKLSDTRVDMKSVIAWKRLSFIALAALVILAVSVATYILSVSDDAQSETYAHRAADEQSGPAGPPIATLTESSGTLLVDDQLANAGSEYTSGTYVLESGSAKFLLTNLVAVDLHGATHLHVTSPRDVTLERGSAAFDVPHAVNGFTVHLPGNVRVVDLGTRFNVTINAHGDSMIAVLEGRVKVISNDVARVDSEIVKLLTAGEQARVIATKAGDDTLAYRIEKSSSISINFGGAGPRSEESMVQAATGIVLDPAWNNVTANTDHLTDSRGQPTEASIRFSPEVIGADGKLLTWTNDQPDPTTTIGRLFVGRLDAGSSRGLTNNKPVTIQISGIPYARYDVCVYYYLDASATDHGHTFDLTLNGQPGLTVYRPERVDEPGTDRFVATTPQTLGNCQWFRDVRGDIQLVLTGEGCRQVCGLQIIGATDRTDGPVSTKTQTRAIRSP